MKLLMLAVLFFVLMLHLSTPLSIGSKAAEKKKVVCYFASWSVYRAGAGKFDVEDIDPFICTHVIYSFAGLGENNTIISLDPENDFNENNGRGALLRFTGLKNRNPELKTLLALGGWGEGSEKYSNMVSDPAQREVLTASILQFMLEYNFDGLDFDWEYPGNRGGIPSDVQNFVFMLSELKSAFKPYGLMLTVAVGAGKSVIDSAYDVPGISRIVDHIHLMTYDYHGSWETVTGHHSPLYSNPEIDLGENVYANQNFTVNYWLQNGADPSKLILGMGLYGKGFTLNDPANNGYYAEADQPIAAGPYTREPGVWGYNEICRRLGLGSWTVVVDPYYLAPYAYNRDLWIGYDDSSSLTAKAQYAVSTGLGGAMVWAMDTDDFRGDCHGTPFILIKSLYEIMNGPIIYPSSFRSRN